MTTFEQDMLSAGWRALYDMYGTIAEWQHASGRRLSYADALEEWRLYGVVLPF